MKKLIGILALLFAMALPALAQQGRMSPEDQSKFDSYYSHWMDARQKNDSHEIASAEGRMQNLMARYNIPQNVPYDRIASNGGGYDNENRDRDHGAYDHDRGSNYQGARLSPDDQRKFDSYYSHWMDARQKNDSHEVASAEERMQSLMTHYGIPRDVPYDRIASNGH